MFKFSLLFALTFVTIYCNPAHKTMNSNHCDMPATIIDMAGLDGCTWILVTDDNQKLLPNNWPKDFEPKDGLTVKIGYSTMEDAASICMYEDHIIDLKCILVDDAEKPLKPPCTDTDDPESIRWMQLAIIKKQVHHIEKFNYLDGYAYLMKGSNLNNYLYDCQGNLLCSYREIEQNDCSMRLLNLSGGLTIWNKKG